MGGSRRSEIMLALGLALALVVTALLSSEAERRAAPKLETLSSFDNGPGGYGVWLEMLHREGLQTEQALERPAFLSSHVATLIAAQPPRASRSASRLEAQPYGKADQEALERWIRAGGHLVWIAAADSPAAMFHAGALKTERGQIVRAAPASGSPLAAGVRAVEIVARHSLDFRGSNILLEHAGVIYATTRTLGRGRVSVIADGSAFINGRIAHADNARFAFNLAQGARPGSVAFDEWIHGYGAERSLWSVLDAPLRWAVGITALAVLLVLWRSGLRLGAPIALGGADARTSVEFVVAMARLLARAQARAYAIGRLVDPLTPRNRSAELAELRALRHETNPSDRDLLRAAQLCVRLRKEPRSHA